MATATRIIDRFPAKDDTGKRYIVIETQASRVRNYIDGTREEVVGNSDFHLEDRRSSVIPTDDPEVFKIFQTDVMIRKIR